MVNKKGQTKLTEAPFMITMLLLIGLTLFVGAMVLEETRDSQKTRASGTEVNESFLSVTETAQAFTLDTNPTCTASDVLCVNASQATHPISSVNYTVTGCTIAYSHTAASPTNNSNWNCTYTGTYDVRDAFYNATLSGGEALSNIADFQGLWGLVIAASIILGLIFVLRNNAF